MDQLKVKFVGGPRNKKTRSLASPKAPAVIEVPEDCKFYNVRGSYKRVDDTLVYKWEAK